jgi:pantothenate kinase
VSEPADLPGLVRRARSLVQPGRRSILGVTGAPGAGKTTLVEQLVQGLRATGTDVAHLPMDGFHLADVQLDQLGLRDRKGAPETFDAAGYAVALERVLAAFESQIVYVPGFERVLEQPIAAAIAVPPQAPLIITEGNYLLLDAPGWRQARQTLAEVWYVEVPDDVRRERLVDRHVQFGKSPQIAASWVNRSDEANAALVRATRPRADLVVER